MSVKKFLIDALKDAGKLVALAAVAFGLLAIAMMYKPELMSAWENGLHFFQ